MVLFNHFSKKNFKNEITFFQAKICEIFFGGSAPKPSFKGTCFLIGTMIIYKKGIFCPQNTLKYSLRLCPWTSENRFQEIILSIVMKFRKKVLRKGCLLFNRGFLFNKTLYTNDKKEFSKAISAKK
eukprot:UN25208